MNIIYTKKRIANLRKYGRLYNYAAATDSRHISASNAHLPTPVELTALQTFLGTNPGGKLKEIGTTYWNAPNADATNGVGFNARGAGFRRDNGGDVGTFESLGDMWFCWTTMESIDYVGSLNTWSGDTMIGTGFSTGFGFSIRLIVDSPIEIDGNLAVYVGNDLRRYGCILLGGVWWMSENLSETLYRTGENIPNVLLNADWATLSTGAMCAYNNDESNV